MFDPNKTTDPAQANSSEDSGDPGLPSHIGRYRVEKVLGEGGFGLVFLAHDDELQRLVAIKVPHPGLLVQGNQARIYLNEARTVANLDHPHIVPVFDIGNTDQFPCFIVSKYIDGTDLAQRIKQSRLTIHEAVEFVATVAEALHYAHKQGLVHRDIKPSNLLIERGGKPYLTDFGLALRDRDVGKGGRFAGSPAYMSPEQARGEGHRVDGRSDIFSLGVVFYELLTGRQPFKAESQDELLEQIATHDPRPPRQHADAVTRELERICLKALSKKARERYLTAQDLAEDLRQYLKEEILNPSSGSNTAGAYSTPPTATGQTPITSLGSGIITASPTPISDSQLIKIVPKGLRSFDAQDADFFLELLPGPRDREGLPDSLRFWKSRIEEQDADHTFAVGLIYGPSGCGKSSLVKAGLLPRLSADVITLYIEATAKETEARLLNGLRKRFPGLSANLGLKQSLALLRRGEGISVGKKVLIVLDQFEQWLHANKDEQSSELVQALRQCDGGRVQCIVMVRDDFWMAVTRFLSGLEIELLQGHNCAAADLFDLDHARKVLAALGRAFGKLPLCHGETTREQKEFLKQVTEGLSQDGKIICVRLALFAEMMKGKPWTPATLKEVGGTAGVGLTFLEETFASSTASPTHRMHQQAAQAVLQSLLPESGSDIKGHMRSSAELREVSGYADQPQQFEGLLRILDSEIRLITPTDPEGKTTTGAAPQIQPGEKYYQLTHDYLVPSLREWLTRKQKESQRGRAELLLAEQAAAWNARPSPRQLPSLWHWLRIRRLTTARNWTAPQQRMMQAADKHYAVRSAAVAAILILLGWAGYDTYGRLQARSLRDQVLRAETGQVLPVVAKMKPYRWWLNPLLQEIRAAASTSPADPQQLRASLSLLPVDRTQVDYLATRLLSATPSEVPVISEALVPYQAELRDKLWAVVEKPPRGQQSQRLRAAAALALFDPQSDRWSQLSGLVIHDLVQENSVFLGHWSTSFRPIKNRLLPALSDIYRDRLPDRAPERTIATYLLQDYAADQSQVVIDLTLDADEKQFAVMFPVFQTLGEQRLPALTHELNERLAPGVPEGSRERLAWRQANAAAILLRLGHPEQVWPLFRHGPDPRVRSYLIHRVSPFGAKASLLSERLELEPDLTARRALILSLGEYSEEELPSASRMALIPKLQQIYRTHPDPGLHAAAEWLLKKWQQGAWLKETNREWASDPQHEQQRLERYRQQSSQGEDRQPEWYVNPHGQTFVIIPGPVESVMGSPLTEESRQDAEHLHRRRINRTFAVSTKSVTYEQYRKLFPNHQVDAKYREFPDQPVVRVSWFDAAAYCNKLSAAENIAEDQWSYTTNAEGVVTGLKADYLSLTGYRLPTEAEIEYVFRAGATTSRFYGTADRLLFKYAWFQFNSKDKTYPVGLLKPNDLGVFDVQGNVFTWCQERDRTVPEAGQTIDDREDPVLDREEFRVLRGSSFFNPPPIMRSAYRYPIVPTIVINYSGFRVARTLSTVEGKVAAERGSGTK